MNFKASLRGIFCAAAVFVAASAAAGERWRHVEPQESRAIRPNEFLLGADDALWVLSDDGVRRFDASGAVTGVLPTTGRSYASGMPLADGGTVLREKDPGCGFTRVDATLRERWRRQFSDLNSCVFAASANGALWVSQGGEDLYRVGDDGRTAAHVRPLQPPSLLAAMPDGSVAIVNVEIEPARSRVIRYSRDGVHLWTFVRDGAVFSSIATAADGTITASGVIPAPGLASGKVVVRRINASGTPGNEYISTTADPESRTEAIVAADGSSSVLAVSLRGSTDVYAAYRFDAGGRFLWRSELCPGVVSAGYTPSIVPLPGDGLAVACGRPEGGRYERYDATGHLAASAPLTPSSTRLRLRADGRLQAMGGGASVAVVPSLFVLDLDGRTVDAPVPTAAPARELLDARYTDDGAGYLLSRVREYAGNAEHAVLARLNADGSTAWRREIAMTAISQRIRIAGGQPCVTGAREPRSPWTPPPFPTPLPESNVFITCLAAADGSERWSKSFPGDIAEQWFGGLADGGVMRVRSTNTAHEVIRYDSAGNETARTANNGGAWSAAIDASGVVALGVRHAQGDWYLMRYEPDGQGHAINVTNTSIPFEVLDAKGDVVLIVRQGSRFSLWSYSPEGRLLWQHELPPAVGPIGTRVTRVGDSVYVAAVDPQFFSFVSFLRASRLRALDGGVVWETTTTAGQVDDPFLHPPAFAVSDRQAVLVHEDRHRLRLLRHDVRDGHVIGEEIVPCGLYCGPSRDAALDADGAVRVALSLADAAHGLAAAMVALDDTSALAAVRLDQPGLAGAWWAPYMNGQGFVVDWLPASRTWFMPWFTFTVFDGNELSAQRWFAVAGQVPADATQAQLPILATTNGTFDAGGGTTSRQVGTATLRFTDCNNGTLQYAFDDDNGLGNDAVAGTIKLSRLSPATQDCVLADGTVQPHAAAPANGFDARMSGSWFEEATSGQGLQFTVQPGGIFFAPWFTFDPAGTSEDGDPGRQRWYSLQGSLANAQGGRVELVIAQALGGAFDRTPTNDQFAVGSATLTMKACDRATLDYRFDASEAAGDMSGRTGTIELTKIGGCVP